MVFYGWSRLAIILCWLVHLNIEVRCEKAGNNGSRGRKERDE